MRARTLGWVAVVIHALRHSRSAAARYSLHAGLILRTQFVVGLALSPLAIKEWGHALRLSNHTAVAGSGVCLALSPKGGVLLLIEAEPCLDIVRHLVGIKIAAVAVGQHRSHPLVARHNDKALAFARTEDIVRLLPRRGLRAAKHPASRTTYHIAYRRLGNNIHHLVHAALLRCDGLGDSQEKGQCSQCCRKSRSNHNYILFFL